MPLTLAASGQAAVVQKVGGKPEVRKFLESLGFVAGSPVTVLCQNGGNLIVAIKDCRVAVSKEMATKIMI